MNSRMEDLLLSGTGVWRLYVIGDDPSIRIVTFNDDGEVTFTDSQKAAWYNRVNYSSDNGTEDYTATASTLKFENNPDTFNLVYEGVGEENDKKWDVLVFAESDTTLIYMDNRQTDLHDVGDLSAQAGDDWNLILVNDDETGVEKSLLASGKMVKPRREITTLHGKTMSILATSSEMGTTVEMIQSSAYLVVGMTRMKLTFC